MKKNSAVLTLPGLLPLITFIFICIFLVNSCFNSRISLPNIIIIFSDDQGYADLSTFGAEGFSTPHIDRMAAEGMRFSDFYVASSVCSPSRAALLTGCYPVRVGIPEVLAPEGPPWTKGRTNIGLNDAETTIAEMLKTQGYATACIGKWHLGHRAPFLPTRHGFDEYYGLPYSNDMLPDDYPPLPLLDGENIIEYNPDQTQLTKSYTERAVRFIEKNSEKPFFLYMAHSMPHVPIFASDAFRNRSEQGTYGDVIMELDWSVGQIMNRLQELKLDNNTLIIYTSDNGPWLAYGNHAGSAAPLREGKMTTFEGGQRVPCVMRWPAKIPAGNMCREIVTTMDILPTIAAITRAKLPDKQLDGKNIFDLMQNKAGHGPDEAFYYYAGNELQAIRLRQWKLHLPHSYLSVTEVGHDGQHGQTTNHSIDTALFNLDKDISETTDVADAHPHIVKKLSQIAASFDQELKQNARPPGIYNQ